MELNQLWSPNPIDVPVVAVKSAGTLRLAFDPKRIPAEFIKNRLELPPVTGNMPLIMEFGGDVVEHLIYLFYLVFAGFDGDNWDSLKVKFQAKLSRRNFREKFKVFPDRI